jgi:hypothetical protein
MNHPLQHLIDKAKDEYQMRVFTKSDNPNYVKFIRGGESMEAEHLPSITSTKMVRWRHSDMPENEYSMSTQHEFSGKLMKMYMNSTDRMLNYYRGIK